MCVLLPAFHLLPSEIISTFIALNNQGIFRKSSNQNIFICHPDLTEAVQCGANNLTAEAGIYGYITSPGFPNAYPK